MAELINLLPENLTGLLHNRSSDSSDCHVATVSQNAMGVGPYVISKKRTFQDRANYSKTEDVDWIVDLEQVNNYDGALHVTSLDSDCIWLLGTQRRLCLVSYL